MIRIIEKLTEWHSGRENLENSWLGIVSMALGYLLWPSLIIYSLSVYSDFKRDGSPIYEEVPNGAVCIDGWRSSSQGPGTCSWHGGVAYYVYKDVFVGYYSFDKGRLTILKYVVIILFILSIVPSFFIKAYFTEFIRSFTHVPIVIVLAIFYTLTVPWLYFRLHIRNKETAQGEGVDW